MTQLERTENQKLMQKRDTKKIQAQQSRDVTARWAIMRVKAVIMKRTLVEETEEPA